MNARRLRCGQGPVNTVPNASSSFLRVAARLVPRSIKTPSCQRWLRAPMYDMVEEGSETGQAGIRWSIS